MAITVGSILQYKHFQSLANQQILNVQYYRVLDEVTVQNLLTPFAENLFNIWSDTLTPVQTSALTHTRGELYEVNGLAFDIYTPATPEPGLISGEYLGTFEAYSFQQVRASRATRHGWKRVAGVPEAASQNGNIVTATMTTLTADVAPLFGEAVDLIDAESPTRTLTLQPIIWGGNDPGFPLGRFSEISGVVVAPRVTTQNSRKVGRGA